MKKWVVTFICISFILIVIVIAEGYNMNKMKENLTLVTKQLGDKEQQIYELKKENENQLEEIKKIDRELFDSKIEVNKLNKEIGQMVYKMENYKNVLELPSLDYEIISYKVNNNNAGETEKETVVLYEGVESIDVDLYWALIYRLAIEFSADPYTKVSIWKDRDHAENYVTGNINPEEISEHFGWRGMDSRFLIIDNTSNPPKLIEAQSGHDFFPLEFGKYKVPEL
ncbi:hypothetical protein [Chengkuizengella axinellae]|uniref:DUF881 domain-containing protein n=1 Tax=Chengkuizengella axinellae TaxID=3064388 RepID=A0ABT9J4U1_9BACL|nr:hypothetical protein [Chengkuizengella sp. 2205SS18-9]MDP5276493.1 hypothetical protein [Chengkuizengella sp. 2205SS18-9]